MEEKYYTPNISEFYVGFEYEEDIRDIYYEGDYSIDNGEKWVNYIITIQDDLEHILDLIEDDKCRIKYLDQQDIEELEFTEGKDEGNVSCYIKGLYRLYWFNDIIISINKGAINNQIFRGVIKNKSELKKLLNQIGI